MMSAPDAPDPRSFSDDAMRQLRGALSETVDDDPRADAALLHEAMERVAAEAHALGLGFEKLLSVVKTAWIDVTTDRDISYDQERAALDHAVHACINAYFREAN
jgi:hypothetical protein